MLERTLPPDLGVPALALALAPAALCDASFAITLERETRGLRPGRTFVCGERGDFAGEVGFPLAGWPTMLVAAAVKDMGSSVGSGLRG